LARQLGERVEPVPLDAAEPATYQALLSKSSVVVRRSSRRSRLSL
jgi:hypothetical protein